jgi:hypothetical protein
VTAAEVAALIRDRITTDYAGNVNKAAWGLGTSVEHLRKQMKGDMPPGRKVLRWLSLERRFYYEASWPVCNPGANSGKMT